MMSSSSSRVRASAEGMRQRLATFERIDREAEEVNRRIADAERRHAVIQRWDKALQVTVGIIESLISRASQEAAPELDRALKQTIGQAPIPGVAEVSLGPSLELKLKIDHAPPHIPAEELWTYLSTGAQKQVALALRLAMARTASGRTNLPLLLDEPLEELDDERAGLVFDYVNQLAQGTQVMVMTCHERLYRWLLEKHPEVHELAIATRV